MSTTTQSTPILLGNMVNNIDVNSFVDLEERDNLIHAFLNDCAFILNRDYGVKTAVRTYDDEFFNLQLLDNQSSYKLLITYFPVDTDYKINDCNANEIEMKYEVFYKMEAQSDNKNKLKDLAGKVNQLMCRNFNQSNLWEYSDVERGKKYSTNTNGNFDNTLSSEVPLFSKISESGFLFLKQEYNFKFVHQNII
jgi:hypothetical protein